MRKATVEEVLFEDGDVTVTASEPDENGGRTVKVTRCCSDETSEKAKKVGTVVFYVVAGVYSAFLSSLFGFLSMLKNKADPIKGAEAFSASWLANVLSSFYFVINIPGVYTKIRNKDYSASYKISASMGIFLAVFNTLAGLKLGMDAIFESPYPEVRYLSWAAVGVFSANTLFSRSIGSINPIYKGQAYVRQGVKGEWTKFEALFTLLEDIDRYGPTLNKEEFSYLASDNESLTTLALRFYAALKKKGVKHIGRKGEAALKVYELGLTLPALYGALTLGGMWTSLGADGLNALGKALANSDWGDNMVPLDFLAAMASMLLYGYAAIRSPKFTVDTISLPIRAIMYYRGKKSDEELPLIKNDEKQNSKLCSPGKVFIISLAVAGFAGAVGVIGWESGAGMYVEASEAVASNYGNLTNSTFFEIIRAPARPVESFLGNVAQAYAGLLVNLGFTVLGVGKRFFYTGTKIYETNDRGTIDLHDWVMRALDTRVYLGLSEQEQIYNLGLIQEARKDWTGSREQNFTWTSMFRNCRGKNEVQVVDGSINSSTTTAASSFQGGLYPVGDASSDSDNDRTLLIGQ